MWVQKENVCEIANFVRLNILGLLFFLVEVGLDKQANLCDKIHDDCEELYQSLLKVFEDEH